MGHQRCVTTLAKTYYDFIIQYVQKQKSNGASIMYVSILQTAGPCLISTGVIVLSGSLQLMRLRLRCEGFCERYNENIEILCDVQGLAEC